MSQQKQVKVDNWGIFFLQRLKHFFNRTDYCDLTLQFQDNAQLKVHRLVLNACTEYFEILERTCEMYEDCLIMPDDLQTDVMVPIINFMYTGHLEYKTEMLEKLYQTSQIMNMTVLTKLLGAQRIELQEKKKLEKVQINTSVKRSFTKAFESNNQLPQKVYVPSRRGSVVKNSPVKTIKKVVSTVSPSLYSIQTVTSKNFKKPEPFGRKPTRYDVPEELDSDNIFDNSFTSISYDSKPLMVHPETKSYPTKRHDYNLFSEASSSKKYDQIILKAPSTSSGSMECRRMSSQKHDHIFGDDSSESYISNYDETTAIMDTNTYQDSNELFDQILHNGSKVTIENKNANSNVAKLDHAKIISEVLKKYPHIIKGNKNIKLRILNTTSKSGENKTNTKKQAISIKRDPEPDYTYQSKVIDSQEAARLIALRAENAEGPWICLICGTPGKALHFTTYYKFRRHLIEVHNEKPIPNICEYCGLKSNKRNYLLHHLYTKHGIEPPPAYHFPKCNQCNYIALTTSYLIKHKLSHTEDRKYRCNECFMTFQTSQLLLLHLQKLGHKICPVRKPDYKCIYCMKTFIRSNNLYAHLKSAHKYDARNDGIIDISEEEDESMIETQNVPHKVQSIKYEPTEYDTEDSNDIQYKIEKQPDGQYQLLSKKTVKTIQKQKILNPDYISMQSRNVHPITNNEFEQNEEMDIGQSENEITHEDLAVKQTVNRNNEICHDEYILPTDIDVPDQTSNEFLDSSNNEQPNMILKRTATVNQPIQIVVSNEEEYKTLMASNSSLLFDENNPNKTLTVLTTPHGSTSLDASATLDLENHQNNEMMIIQDGYPLNVSEAVQNATSNIVVVYSHPTNDQNKQYLVNAHYAQPQLITSQGIGNEFVQSTGVITQSYQSITTSTPIVSGQVLVQQPVQSWHDNNSIVNHINDGQQFEMSMEPPAVEHTDLTELPDIQISEQKSELSAESEIIPQNVNTIIVMPSEQVINPEQIIEVPSIEPLPLVSSIGQIPQILPCSITNTVVLQNVEVDLPVESSNPEEIVTTQDDVEVHESPITSTVVHDISDSTNNENSTNIIVYKEKIQNLASEWSEDDDQTVECEEGNIIDENQIINRDIVNNSIQTSEVEESIENIQEEMNKQIIAFNITTNDKNQSEDQNVTLESDHHLTEPSEEIIEPCAEIIEPCAEVIEPCAEIIKPSNEKICSLLNDWEENESQNGDVSTDQEREETLDIVASTAAANEDSSPKPEMASIKIINQDNIKKLVSDWDEEDDDNKE